MLKLFITVYTLFTGVVFFFRGKLYAEMDSSVTQSVPILLVALYVLLAFRPGLLRRHLWHIPKSVLMLWVVSVAATLFANLADPTQSKDSTQVCLEFTLSILVYIQTFIVARSGLISLPSLLNMLQLLGTIASIWIIQSAAGLMNVRRVYVDGTSVNHIGHALAIFTAISLGRLIQSRGTTKNNSSVAIHGVLSMLGLVAVSLTGTRSAALGLCVALALLVWNRAIKIRSFLLLLVAGMGIFLFFDNQERNFQSLRDRFTFDTISIGISARTELWESSFADTDFEHLMIGRPSFSLHKSDNYDNPHNIFISMLRSFGIAAFLLFTFTIAHTLMQFPFLSGKRRVALSLDFVLLASSLCITIVYASVSGRLTRIITIFYLLGFTTGIMSRQSLLRSFVRKNHFRTT